jgi:uncharacterized protein (TIGR03083 family)
VEPIEEWANAQRRVIEMITGLSGEQASIRVPACPAWTVRELLSHMIGLNADVLAGDEPDDHTSVWTQAQVDRRAGCDVTALLAEWRDLTEPMRAWMHDHGTRPMNDVLIHEQDLRGALGVPGAQDTPGLAALRERFAGRVADRVTELPSLALIGPGWRWASSGSPDDAAVVVRASDFDLARAVMSRRSAAQLRRWTVQGDVEPYLTGFTTLGALPDRDLSE